MLGLAVRVAPLLLCLPSLAWAQDYPASQSLYVNDFADIIDAKTELRISETLQELKKDQGIEMTVVTISSVNDYGSTQSVPDFTTGLFNAWGVGDATRNDGIVFLTSIRDREMFIGLGSGYPPVYDDRMDRVFEYHVKPYFVKDEYAQGIEVGVLETIKRTSTNYVATPSKPSLAKRVTNNLVHYMVLGIISIVGIFVIGSALRKKVVDFSYGWRRCPTCSSRTLTRMRTVTKTPTRQTKGEEHILVGCSNCTYQIEHVASLSHLSVNQRGSGTGSSGGGGRSGGGSSGGGGGGGW